MLNWIILIILIMYKEYDYIFKIVIVGSSSVGKSSILKRFADGDFNAKYISTIGVDFRFKSDFNNIDHYSSMVNQSNYKSGIQQDKKDLNPLLTVITKELMQ